MHDIPDPIARAIEAAHIPALPQALLRLLQLVDDDGATTAQLARVVEQDPGLCARLLTAANSPALRRGSDLSTIDGCLVALGTRLIRSVATCLAVKSVFDRSGAAPKLDLAGFWCHSLHVAELARTLAASDGYSHPDQAYLAGLLHDVGILVMLSAIGDDYAELLAGCGGEGLLAAGESERFGVQHAEVATWMIDRWNLADSFADAVLFHHEDAAQIEAAGRLPQIVWLAHALVDDATAAEALEPLARSLFGAPIAAGLGALREESKRSMRTVAEAVGAVAGGQSAGDAEADSLPRIRERMPRHDSAAEDEIDACVGSMAALQPLQSDLFGLESDAELLLSLREATRILFDISRIAFLLLDQDDGSLSGARIGGQHAVFGRARLHPRDRRCLAATAVDDGRPHSSFAAAPVSLIDRQFMRALDCDGLLCVPLIARRRTIGVMILGLSAAQHSRLARRQAWVLNFARIAAASLEAWQDARAYRRQADDDASARFERQARRIVHEAGNPLGIIRGYLKLLDGRIPEESGLRDEIAVLREEIDRVAAIVLRMSELPPRPADGGNCELVRLLREMLSLYREPLFAARGIEVEFAVATEACQVACDRETVTQILLNLWKNAAEAMSAGGRIAIAVAAPVERHGRLTVALDIDDSGPGIAATATAGLRRPDLASRSDGRGIGLSIIGALAERAGIEISFAGRSGVGTRTTLVFPVGTQP